MNLTRWMVRPGERKQISLIKIPAEEVKKHQIKGGQILKVIIKSNSKTLYQGPLRVSSGHELYLPKHVKETLKNEKELQFEIINNGGRT